MEWSTNMYYYTNETWKHYAIWKEPDTKVVYYVIPFILNVQTR